jgi:hypothetical protein
LQKEAKEFITRATELKEKIDLINVKKSNPWQAPPVTHYETDFLRKERINEDIKPGHVIIEFKTSDSLKKSGATHLKLRLELNDKITLKHKI